MTASRRNQSTSDAAAIRDTVAWAGSSKACSSRQRTKASVEAAAHRRCSGSVGAREPT